MTVIAPAAPRDSGASIHSDQVANYVEAATKRVSNSRHLIPGMAFPIINSVGIVGAGTMGTGIASAFVLNAIPVVLIDQSRAALDRARDKIWLIRDKAAAKRSIPALDNSVSPLITSSDLSALAETDLIIEAAYETMEVKAAVFESLDHIAKDNAILATNTSYLDVNAIARLTRRPEAVIGMHFFSPAHIMKLVEVIRADETAIDTTAAVIDVVSRIGKIPVEAGSCSGFIGNRMLAIRRQEADTLILEGANLYEVDSAVERFGFPMGPFRVSDLAGLDLGWSREKSTGRTIRERLCERGRLGQKAGAGFYDYSKDGKPAPSPLVDEMVAQLAKESGKPPGHFGYVDLISRIFFPMINEGAKILAERKALCASDIDIVWLKGFGWPAQSGGPMYWADHVGLDKIIRYLEALSIALGPQYAPSELLSEISRSGRRLSDYQNQSIE